MEMRSYDVFWRGELIGKIVDFNKGLIDAVRNMNAEIEIRDMQDEETGDLLCPKCLVAIEV